MRILIDGQTLATPERRRGIGLAFLQVASRLVADDIAVEWHITVADPAVLADFPDRARRRLCPVLLPPLPEPLDFEARTRAWTAALRVAMAAHRIDALWLPNPMMLNVACPDIARVGPVYATVYDLIPWRLGADYLDRWPAPVRAEYLRRATGLARHARALLAISRATADDLAAFDAAAAGRTVVAPLAVDHEVFRASALPRFADEDGRPYVLFTGGFDPRKNMDRALEAFARLKRHPDSPVPAGLRFYVVCAHAEADARAFRARAEALGVGGDVRLTGWVDEPELVRLYQHAAVFFFPSRYEGFGLPLLEALSCGTPVVTLANSSLPEVGGEQALYARSDSAGDLAQVLARALAPGMRADEARAARIAHAARFDWDATAAAYKQSFRRAARARPGRARLRVAYFSPWPPHRSGVATYSRELVGELASHVDLTLVVAGAAGAEPAGVPILEAADHGARRGDFDIALYHVGNNSDFHETIYREAWDHPGVAVIHDVNIHPFLQCAYLGTARERYYREALETGYGHQGAIHYHRIKAGLCGPDIWGYAMSHGLAARSHATIVHSAWAGRELAGRGEVFVVPHGSHLFAGAPTAADRAMRGRLAIGEGEFVVSVFGFVNFLKRVPVVLRAVKRLVDDGYPVRFVIAGSLVDPAIGIERLVDELGLAGRVSVTGFLSDAQFDGWIRLSDVVVNLRCPSMGESSGSLLRALGHGRPVVVSRYQQFAEFPERACPQVQPEQPREVDDLADVLEGLLRSRSRREAAGAAALAYVRDHSSFAEAAALYAEALHAAHARLRRARPRHHEPHRRPT